MEIRVDNLAGRAIAAFLEEHIQDMRAVSPPESKHALDLDGLRRPEITFWTAVEQGEIVGCCALKHLDGAAAEIKSMRVATQRRGSGIGSALVGHLIREAGRRRYEAMYLETGAMEFFAPARRLYGEFGFLPCGPFGNYKADANSVFMMRKI